MKRSIWEGSPACFMELFASGFNLRVALGLRLALRRLRNLAGCAVIGLRVLNNVLSHFKERGANPSALRRPISRRTASRPAIGLRESAVSISTKQIRDHRGTKTLFKTDGDNIIKYFLPNG